MSVVYLDEMFFWNGLIDYLLLLSAARLAGEPLYRRRFALAAALGGLYAAALFLPGWTFLSHPACKAGCAALMLVLAYGKSRRFWRESLLFLALTCAFGGFVLAAQWMGGKGLMVQRGVYYAGGNSKLLFLTAALGAAAVGLIYRGILRHSGLDRELTAVRLELGERRVELTALVDNGNTLTDPVSGQSVVVAEGERLRSLFPPENCPKAAELRDPASAMERLGAGEWKRRFCLLPYRAVGVERGLLLAVRVDRLWAAGEDMGSRLVALSPTPVSDGGGYQALMGN